MHPFKAPSRHRHKSKSLSLVLVALLAFSPAIDNFHAAAAAVPAQRPFTTPDRAKNSQHEQFSSLAAGDNTHNTVDDHQDRTTTTVPENHWDPSGDGAFPRIPAPVEPILSGWAPPPPNSTHDHPYHLWYRQPASEQEFVQAGFLLGHGNAQVMFSGRINQERLILNEASCWSGGPGEYPEYYGGNLREENKGNHKAEKGLSKDYDTDEDVSDQERGGVDGDVMAENAADRREALQELRHTLAEKPLVRPTNPLVKKLMGPEQGFGHQVPFGEVMVEEWEPLERVIDYRRSLDLERGIATVSYTSRGVNYTREHFCSYPDSVCVMRIQASESRKMNLRISLLPNHRHESGAEHTNIHNRLGFRAHLASNNLTLEAGVVIKPEGPTGVSMALNDRQVVVMGFDTITLYYAFGTGWNPNGYPSFRDQDPHERLMGVLDKAANGWYGDLLERHLKDHQELFGRFRLEMGKHSSDDKDREQQQGQADQEPWTLTTEELFRLNAKGVSYKEETFFELMLLQYGRYMLMATSRPGSLPLSGSRDIWTQHDQQDKGKPETQLSESRYKFDIEVQMNYWLSETTNLGETALPLIDYMEQQLVPRGQDTAGLMHGARGWTAYTYSNIWAHTGPTCQPDSFYFPAAAAWLSLHAWDRFQYSQDSSLLKDRVYKMMKGASLFWFDSLVQRCAQSTFGDRNCTAAAMEDPSYYLASPSHSPEHGPFTEGSALDQQLTHQLFEATLEAAKIVGDEKRDKVFVQTLEGMVQKLSKGLRVGNWGQIQEWDLDLDEPNEEHPFLGPLYGFFPGYQGLEASLSLRPPSPPPAASSSFSLSLVNEKKEDGLLEAARVTLSRRGDGTANGNFGWAKIWRAGVWARLGDGSPALEALNLYKRNNLWVPGGARPELGEDSITGRLGFGAVLVEMLVQSPKAGVLLIMPSETTSTSTLSGKGLPERWMVPPGRMQGFRTREGHSIGVEWQENQVTLVEIYAGLKSGPLDLWIGTLSRADKGVEVKVVMKGSSKAVVFSRVGKDWVRFSVVKGQTYLVRIGMDL